MSVPHSVDTLWAGLVALNPFGARSPPPPPDRFYACYENNSVHNKNKVHPYYVCEPYAFRTEKPNPVVGGAGAPGAPGAPGPAPITVVTVAGGCPEIYDQANLSLKMKGPVLIKRND
jgi:hypothetical protein